ncbi:hypothetical protein WLF14_08220 [Pseudomonas fluorescens]|uniref:hypothetical protein n=1 Tax=Pseudomonas fluorescens TaxID=294 RepID=UPI00313DF601
MKNQQDNSSALPALLRAADSVDTLETNSLCCAAAGIIAPSSATAEALIPHEKLRGAALADATLNAQERPLAQPVVGCKPTYDILLKIQIERISITWEYEGGCHVWRYWDNDTPCEKAYGNTIQEALEKLDIQND